jgi:hypothetical protein
MIANELPDRIQTSIYRCRVRFVMQTSGTMLGLPAERASQVPELEVEAGGQRVESCGLII